MKLYFFKTPTMKKEVNQAVDVCWKANMDMAEDKSPRVMPSYLRLKT